jgi:uncharacterized membrane protein YoaK (UPF0700 family)
MPSRGSSATSLRTARSSAVAPESIAIVIMSLVTGATDAITYTRLGNVFASVMTGNMVLLGVSVGRRESALAAHVGVSLAAYLVGTLIGARICGDQPSLRRWRRRAAAAFKVELLLFGALSIGWELSDAHPSAALQLGLLPMAVVAMAIQASIARSLPQQTPSTTYMTGTLTSAVAALVRGSHLREQQRRLAVLAGLVVGAGAATGLVVGVPRWAPLLVLILMTAALATVARPTFIHVR